MWLKVLRIMNAANELTEGGMIFYGLISTFGCPWCKGDQKL